MQCSAGVCVSLPNLRGLIILDLLAEEGQHGIGDAFDCGEQVEKRVDR